MALAAGIVGLPNVGKSTLFNAITNSRVEAANYAFATINPNVGVVEVKDERLKSLAGLITPEKIVYTSFKFVDIAGLVKGASQGEGLGNQFLANIREVDAICHMVRCFEDKSILHVHNKIDALNDIGVINLELIIADLDVINKRISKIKKKAEAGDKESKKEYLVLEKAQKVLLQDQLASTGEYDEEELKILQNFQLITMKPVLYVANIAENEIHDPETNPEYVKVKAYAQANNANCIALSARMEYEISVLDDETKTIFMNDLGMKQTGLDAVTKAAYDLLDLQTFFTYGKIETRAWTFKKGMNAQECAGVIHTDFAKGFIKAEIISYTDLLKHKSEQAIKEAGLLRIEGKNYIMQDGDVCHFRFNVTK
ncbi:redox-regulated ATPase YchF [Ureaplasma miroungigenitalium]|uniref:Ribosome-binding ATPase YchF n=1 Tax=Ureaplasma miroungigenitalium TaxID=1042321 RepID=A0ABT3BNB5_9BACT|nr:redox-regulated ATPase YchF [Ureaplasma miroungigenitalium]MCV3728716.1 redox-regulated ATPase YchF [Ureaplasma miroungigenitalium]MCV3734480.1 redox-regulated ATPase YchF [Ureaplasma miroungigenitalium]